MLTLYFNNCRDCFGRRMVAAKDKLSPEYKTRLCITTPIGSAGRHIHSIFNGETIPIGGALFRKQLEC